MRDFHEFASFLENCRKASRKLLGWLRSVIESLRVSRKDFGIPKNRKKEKILFFLRFVGFLVFSAMNAVRLSD